jgi:hypothetical protein
MRRHSISLYSPFGQYLDDLPFVSVAYTLAERRVGELTLTLPPDQRLPLTLFAKDGILLVTRAAVGVAVDVQPWLIRRRRLTRAADGRISLTLGARHPNDLLRRRIVAYAAGSAEADKSGAADNLIKAVARENFVSPTDTARTMSGFTVASDVSAAPSVSKAFSRQNVLSVAQSLCQMSAQAGTYLGFEVRGTGTLGSYQLVTYTGQRGTDRRITSGRYLPIGPDQGVGAYSVEDDWSEEATFVYAGGQGEREARDVEDAEDAAASAASPQGRAERFREATMIPYGDTAALQDEADAALYAAQARVRFDGQAQDAPGAIYGRDYGWGDLLTVTAEGRTFDCRVDPVRITEDDRGEQRDIRLTSETVL